MTDTATLERRPNTEAFTASPETLIRVNTPEQDEKNLHQQAAASLKAAGHPAEVHQIAPGASIPAPDLTAPTTIPSSKVEELKQRSHWWPVFLRDLWHFLKGIRNPVNGESLYARTGNPETPLVQAMAKQEQAANRQSVNSGEGLEV